ncbi:hypothetical protein [Streptomyces sp. NBC_01601]|uniref:hypothetical protein n=1 Tax=Streptomyces sp. NBC_01601 TaxID=2975892 RepID=UPI002E2B1B07|nr:hypothetical protein [Streptomyces sp. NBC_01601]
MSMTNPPTPTEPGRDDVQATRQTALEYLQMVADSAREPYDAQWGWNEFRLWVPSPGDGVAYAELQQLFGACTPEAPETVEILCKVADDAGPEWFRVMVVGVRSDRERPALIAWWANPQEDEVEVCDIVAVRPSVDGLPLSCTGADSPHFEPSTLRGVPEPEDLLPEIEMSEEEAGLFISQYLHQESHRVGPLWTTIDAQAAATRDRLMEIVTRAGAAGSRTDVNITVAVRDTSVPCPQHVYDPLPAYAGVDEDRTAGLHLVEHAHRDGSVGVEGSTAHLRAVLTCVALYGGNVHLATVPLDGATVPLAEETLYRVHYDWRCERVEGEEQRTIRELSGAIEDQSAG